MQSNERLGSEKPPRLTHQFLSAVRIPTATADLRRRREETWGQAVHAPLRRQHFPGVGRQLVDTVERSEQNMALVNFREQHAES
ncbi:hypothetical protein DMJ13_19850 [halophilic archaeon]|nr:hypothetical protein DMJ13_19850 [halophilic archaeon]